MSEWVTYTRQKLMWLLENSGPGHIAEVSCGSDSTPWKYRMRIVEENVHKGPALSNGKWDDLLYHAIRSSGRALIMVQEGNFFLGVDPLENLKQVGKVMDFEIVGRKVLGKRDSKRKAINSEWKNSGIYFYQFGKLLTSDIYGLALYLYGEINPYSVGQAYAWNNQNEYTPKEFSGESGPFRVSDFIAAGNHYNSRGKVAGVAFLHNTRGVINGLEELKEIFPQATAPQVRDLYREFGLTPSSHVGDIFSVEATRNSKSSTPPQVDAQGKRSRKSLDYYIKKYNLYPKKNGYLNFESPTIGEMVAMNPEKLYEMLIGEGETISTKQTNKVWQKCLGDD